MVLVQYILSNFNAQLSTKYTHGRVLVFEVVCLSGIGILQATDTVMQEFTFQEVI